ncbi:hypothetical protein BATDEDRAFT_9677 [Batrachochytrium dendrobatidis JAM81]|uniref:Uncharacterized protein n=1 Tax=Batrachochytrium dendrobatidis (strain JAM81 / FGSC 10211) TaxID=684364 RepID=F4NWX3_BATDJ|nr:uncharacterized protein BATDEDRAFT_9677 [Batrachochytrium dendrobatidis JAM81]EGF82896.1 hypothetical protein BATDEDRAFT_9677 [Batrachochytrium dendrobatidis JAM81]|eukprot:XP_006676539.1 hypothetical protein BATDEDRAFT_9677 [Batrachochytrium dendrobatidis JAM81]
MYSCPTDELGRHAIHWIEFVFHECAYTHRDSISMFLGYTSITCWFFAQIPQLRMNWINGSAKSLSIYFVSIWLLGDITNLVGCILTNQLPFQIYLAVYFVLVDSILFLQWMFYWYTTSPRPILEGSQEFDERSMLISSPLTSVLDDADRSLNPELPLLRPESNCACRSHSNVLLIIFNLALIFTIIATVASFGAPFVLGWLSSSQHHHSNSTNIHIEPDQRPVLNSYDLGRFISWICTALYLSSRPPQIYLNMKRKTCEGLSLNMFFGAVLGNIAYTMSIFVKSSNPSFLLQSLPYLLGSGGTVLFDCVIFGQYLVYNMGWWSK